MTTIFVVDENPAIASTIAQILNGCRSEFQALTCNGPYGAMQLAQAVKPNLVLMDTARDARNALLCSMALRELYSVEVVLMTAGIDLERTVRETFPQAVRPFPVLQKPMEPLQILDEIRRYSRNSIFPAQVFQPEKHAASYCRGAQRHVRTSYPHARRVRKIAQNRG
ncbi:MAG: response regulator [Acidobacteria bacterium]|nr:response regulator [Acidobacteriota bacterium]